MLKLLNLVYYYIYQLHLLYFIHNHVIYFQFIFVHFLSYLYLNLKPTQKGNHNEN